MEKRIHLYVSRKNVLTWLMTACLVCSAVARIVMVGMKGTDAAQSVWSQIVLPTAATLLFAAICLFDGKEHFYKTAIPVWMMAGYGAAWTISNVSGKLLVWLICVALVFLCFLYTEITSGKYRKAVWFLVPMMLATLVTVLYENKAALLSGNLLFMYPVIPDSLVIVGCCFLVFALRISPEGNYYPTWGDRSDGRRLRTLPAMAQASPYLMVNRNGSSNLFSESFEITNIDRYIRQKRREGLVNFGIVHVFLTCYCRCVARYPGLNRFIAGQKVYSRGEDIQYCMVIKKEMSASSPDTAIKVHLSPRDTVYDVYNKMNAVVEQVKNTPLDSGFDNTAAALTMVPGVLLKFVVWLLKTMDYFGLLPKFLLEVSPFHGSLFFTSLGSLGIPTIYHHLYDFGNLPVFGAFGCKRRAVEVEEDGTIVQRKYVDFKFTLDERIVDGFYYAAFFKHFKRVIAHPEQLDLPPEEVIADID